MLSSLKVTFHQFDLENGFYKHAFSMYIQCVIIDRLSLKFTNSKSTPLKIKLKTKVVSEGCNENEIKVQLNRALYFLFIA